MLFLSQSFLRHHECFLKAWRQVDRLEKPPLHLGNLPRLEELPGDKLARSWSWWIEAEISLLAFSLPLFTWPGDGDSTRCTRSCVHRWHCRTAIANRPHLGSPRFWSYSEHPVIPVTWTKLKRSVEPFLLSLQNKVWICWNVTLNTWKAVSNKMTVEICWDYISLLDHSCTQGLSDLGE